MVDWYLCQMSVPLTIIYNIYVCIYMYFIVINVLSIYLSIPVFSLQKIEKG